MRSIYHVSSVVIVTQTTRIVSYYNAYLAFFTDYLHSHSSTKALERFIFAPTYNFRSDLVAHGRDSKVQPQILIRIFAGMLHPLYRLPTASSLASSGRSHGTSAQCAHFPTT